MDGLTRERFLKLTGAALLTPWVAIETPALAGGADERLQVDARLDPRRVFGLSVASGDPSPSGVVLWTRINPEAYRWNKQLAFEVADDETFKRPVVKGLVPRSAIGPQSDFTARVDLAGRLEANRRYFYRFVYDSTASRVGRCRTLPEPGAGVDRLRLGVVTCQDYTNGYYGAFSHLARADVDFVVHLGDLIYESAGDPRYQSLPYPDRTFTLPSGEAVAFDLADFRFIYRTYRGDPLFQEALERHTWITIWDDHETCNDSYWDYERDTLGAPDHPYTTDPRFGNDPARLRQLKLDSQRAWLEYVPARVDVQPSATHPHDYLRTYRSFRFGNLLELFCTDERTYRTKHPCGERDYGERYLSPGCLEQLDPVQDMLGVSQRTWLLQGLTESPALWKGWANEVFTGRFKVGASYVTLDAWDGFEAERRLIMETLRQAGMRNLVVLTGDLHTYLASYLLADYDLGPLAPGNRVGVEYMTPAVTSSNLYEIVTGSAPAEGREALRGLPPEALTELAVRTQNPHIAFFNSQRHGYSTMEWNREYFEYVAYSVDKTVNGAGAAAEVLKVLRTPVNRIEIVEG